MAKSSLSGAGRGSGMVQGLARRRRAGRSRAPLHRAPHVELRLRLSNALPGISLEITAHAHTGPFVEAEFGFALADRPQVPASTTYLARVKSLLPDSTHS